MRKGRFAYVAVALLFAVSPLAGCGEQDDSVPSQDDLEVPAGVMEALQRDLGLTADQARARLRAEAAAARIEPVLRDQLGADFAGAWMSADGLQLMVGITDMAAATTVRDADATPVLVARGLPELNAIARRLDEQVDEPAAAGIHAWHVDVAANAVVVWAADPGAVDLDALVGDRDAVVVRRSDQRPRPLYDVRGGDEIILGGNILCSMGFAVHGGYVTAGHCGSAGTQTAGSNWVASGSVVDSTFPVHDYAWVRTNGSWNSVPAVNDYAGGAVPVAGSNVASVGSSVCRSGRTTGWRCGTIEAHDVTINYAAGPVYGATRTSACAEGGDSGGSFISGSQAQGVTSGGSGSCSTGGVTFYQPVRPILATYGLTLKTRGQNQAKSIASQLNGKCIDVPAANFADGVKLQMWGCNGTNAQQWTFTGGTIRAGGKCMDVAWGATHDGARIQIANCSGHPAQQFVLNGAGDLVSLHANKCVDIAGWDSNHGAQLITWSCHGGANQKWSLQ